MREMCSVCIIRAQRDDDDFLPCSASCFRAAIAAAFQSGMDQMIGGIEQISYDRGQRDERERIRAACIEMKHRDGCACDVIDSLNRIDAAPRVSGRQP